MIKKSKKTPWPTKKAMEQVYDLKLWGGTANNFYSGDGSHALEITMPYIKEVTSFLKSFKAPISVCDLGCGDFNIGKQLIKFTKEYTAVDIVTDLIAYNKKQFKEEKVSFLCKDLATDTLPKADCALIRQVLQHLSNKEIQSIVTKLYQYKYVILTEHIPDGNFKPNLDIISGQGIRLKKQSGVNLLLPPFNFKVKEAKQLSVVSSKKHKGIIITYLYKVF